MHRWADDELAKVEAEYPEWKAVIMLIKIVRDDVRAHYEDKIESIINEFGDNPTECLMMIGEYIELARHYRAHPNAERVD